MFNESFFSFLGNVQGATSATILMLIVAQARLNIVKLHYAVEVQNFRRVTLQDII